MADFDTLLQECGLDIPPEEAAYLLSVLNSQAQWLQQEFERPELTDGILGVEPTTHNPALADPTLRQGLRPDEVSPFDRDPKKLFGSDVLDAQGYVVIPAGDG